MNFLLPKYLAHKSIARIFLICKRDSVYPVLILIGIWALMIIFSGNEFGIQGDDIWILNPDLRNKELTDSLQKGYLNQASIRAYLVLTLIGIFYLSGNSLIITVWFFLVLWLINGVLSFILFNRFFKTWPSLLASIFFLVYAGKYEIVPILSAGLYQGVMCSFLCILLLVTSEFSFRFRAIGIAIIFWVSLHWYELLVPFAPLLPIYCWASAQKKLIFSSFQNYFYSLLPSLIVLLHISILTSNGGGMVKARIGPIYDWGLIFKIPYLALLNYDGLLGPRHWGQVVDNWRSLNTLFLVERFHGFLLSEIVLVIVLLCLTSLAWKDAKKNLSVDSQKKHTVKQFNKISLIVVALYILLVAHLISIQVLKDGFTPPRFIYIPSLALAIVAAWLMGLGKWKARIVIAIFGIWIIFEAVAMKNILLQYSTSYEFDKNIRTQLKTFNLKPNVGDTIFISLPRNLLMNNAWKQAPSTFESESEWYILLIDFPSEKKLLYKRGLREIGSQADSSFNEFLYMPEIDFQKIFPFYLDENNKLCAIDEFIYFDPDGSWRASKRVLNFLSLDKNLCYRTIRVNLKPEDLLKNSLNK